MDTDSLLGDMDDPTSLRSTPTIDPGRVSHQQQHHGHGGTQSMYANIQHVPRPNHPLRQSSDAFGGPISFNSYGSNLQAYGYNNVHGALMSQQQSFPSTFPGNFIGNGVLPQRALPQPLTLHRQVHRPIPSYLMSSNYHSQASQLASQSTAIPVNSLLSSSNPPPHQKQHSFQ